jgi:hypothetical protein
VTWTPSVNLRLMILSGFIDKFINLTTIYGLTHIFIAAGAGVEITGVKPRDNVRYGLVLLVAASSCDRLGAWPGLACCG